MASTSYSLTETYTFEWKDITDCVPKHTILSSDLFYSGKLKETAWRMKYYRTDLNNMEHANPIFILDMYGDLIFTASGKLFITNKNGRLGEMFLPQKTLNKKEAGWVELLKISDLSYPLNIRCELSIVIDNGLSLWKRVNCCTEVVKDIHSLLTSKRNTDVSIITRDNKKLAAHKLVLVARSEYFAAMFESNLRESLQGNIEIPDMDGCDVEEMLQYIYSGNLTNWSLSVCMNLFVAGDKYKLNGLKEACSLYLQENMTTEVSVKIVTLADMHRDDCLKKSALIFITKNAKEVLSTPDWKIMVREQCHLVDELILEMAKKS